MKLSPFGRWIRGYRMDIGEKLGEMADKLGKSASYLSAVEVGHKSISANLVAKLIDVYSLDEEKLGELKKHVKLANKEFRIPVTSKNFEAIELLARRADNLSEEELEQIKKILNKPAKKERTKK